MKNKVNLKAFIILLGLSLVSVICIFPYVVSIQGEMFIKTGVPIVTIFVAQFIQSIVLFSVTIFLGLKMSSKINFQLPLIDAISKRGNIKNILNNIIGKSILVGVVTAIIIYCLDVLFTALGVSISTHQNYAPIWQKLLAAVYGGVAEEILMRLFLVTFFIWLTSILFREKQPSNLNIMSAIVLAAVIFGLGHLPITSSLTTITPTVVGRAVVLNGVGGVAFGWLFWKKGLESAMIAHFTADIFLLTLLPLIF